MGYLCDVVPQAQLAAGVTYMRRQVHADAKESLCLLIAASPVKEDAVIPSTCCSKLEFTCRVRRR